jgi:hypothetical protein
MQPSGMYSRWSYGDGGIREFINETICFCERKISDMGIGDG